MLYQPTCTNLALVQPKILKIVFTLKNLLFELGNTEEMFGNYLIISACANKLSVEIETTVLTSSKFPILLLTHTGTD